MTVADPKTRRWTRDEYYQMADLGFFQDQRVELINGEIIELAPQKDVHAAVVSLVQRALERAFGERHWVRTQLPLLLGETTEPEPDVSVVAGGPRDYIGTDHPTSALLVVEVSETTLSFDRGVKAKLYAESGIQEYWIVNLVDQRVEVHRNAAGGPAGVAYAEVNVYRSGDSITPLACPQSKVLVADLLP